MARPAPYSAMIYHNNCQVIRRTEDMMPNVMHVVRVIKGMVGTPSRRGFMGYELPIKLVVLPEAFCTGWPDSFLDMGREQLEEVFNTTVPGPETEKLAEAARHSGVYIMGSLQAKDPAFMKDKFFNIAFIIDPDGNLVYKRHKTSMFFRESLTCPTDVWDRYVELYGNDPKALMDALYPVARTEIGNLAVTICGEGDKPEVFRALAMNGAEVVARISYIPNLYESFELQNRANAHFNNIYVLAPNQPVLLRPETSKPMVSEQVGHIVDYRGTVIAKTQYTGPGETVATAIIDVEQLRHYRVESLWQNWLAQLRVEQYALPYEYALSRGGLYPKNLGMVTDVVRFDLHDEVLRYCVNRAVELGMWTPPEGWVQFKIGREATALVEAAASSSGKRAHG
jgi:beta-ureidopropionase